MIGTLVDKNSLEYHIGITSQGERIVTVSTEELRRFPTGDYEKVIRCKDCLYNPNGEGVCVVNGRHDLISRQGWCYHAEVRK